MEKGRWTEFRQALKTRNLILDGSMGALLMRRGLPAGYAPDLWNLENPEVIEAVQKEYADAGSDILITNTFGASKLRLQEYDAYDQLKEINAAAVEIARRAGGGRCFVAGDIGPCGDTIYPTGNLPFQEAVNIFEEQARALIDAGVDLIIIETMFDSLDYKAALSAVRAVSKEVPIIALMTFNTDGLSDTGISPESCVAIAEGFHADVVGANCSVGPEAMIPVVERMKKISNIPIAIQPNAGMPELRGAETVFPLDANRMTEFVEPFFKAGARILGGCCGTTPDYIRNVRRILDDRGDSLRPYSDITEKRRVLLSSKIQTVAMGPQYPFVKIGEKINPTGRKRVADLIREGNIEALMKDAIDQATAGANVLDINVGVPLIDEPGMMSTVITAIQNSVEIPLCIDSSFSEALLRGGEVYYGRPLLNSINAEEEKLEEVIPIAQKVGGAVLALVTETEVPEKAEDRLKYAELILRRLIDAGFQKNDVVFDVLSLTASAMRKGALETFRTIELIEKELGCATTYGLSNSSFGLPNRRFVHQAYLMQGIQHGLSSAIMNVLEQDIAVRVAAAEIFSDRANAVDSYLADWSNPIAEGVSGSQEAPVEEQVEDPTKKMGLSPLETEIFWDIADGKKEKIVTDLQKFIAETPDKSFDLFINVMTPGIRYLGDLFAVRKRFIPHLVAAAEAMKVGVKVIEPYLVSGSGDSSQKATVIFATVKGDIHDIGKNICVLMLSNFGYNVIDLGRNVAMEDIFEAAEEHKASIIALSALMTTTMIQMKLLVEENKRRGYSYRVMVGGAPVTDEFAKEIGADGYSDDVGSLVGETEKVFSALGYREL
ncbi:MAG: homocysteine S-methyltransferase family protein [Bdellovibrionales bacterium]|nr:homocysteine S-methyltransferase family protein [Bdellovibrionales bacterium]